MGQYLECGIAQRIIVESRYNEDNKTILERIGKNIDLSIYNVIEEDDCIELEMKKEIFEKYAVDFIIEQSKYFGEYGRFDLDSLLKIKGLKYDELIDIANEKSVYNFQFLDGNYINMDISYLDPKSDCRIYGDFISFIGDGKAFFECYNRIFTYLRNCIINSSNNPIRSSAIITIYG